MNNRIGKYLEDVGIIPITDADITNGPKSIIVDQKIDEFPASISFPPGSIAWSPSLPNWNPWRAANIDEKPLAFVIISFVL